MVYWCQILTRNDRKVRDSMKHGRREEHTAVAPPWVFALFTAGSFLWMEWIFRAFVIDGFFGIGLLLSLLFTLPLSIVAFLLCTLGNQRINRIVSCVLLGISALVFSSQIVYHGVFDTFYIVYSVQNVGQVMQFWRDIFLSLFRNLPAILCMWVPMARYIAFGRRLAPACRLPWKGKGVMAAALIALHAAAVLVTLQLTTGDMCPARLYTKEFSVDASMQSFGVVTTARLDLKYLIFGAPIEDVEGDASLPTQPVEPTPEPEPIVYGDNVLDSLDFEQLAATETDKTIQSMHEYFASVTPTKENEYTGKF